MIYSMSLRAEILENLFNFWGHACKTTWCQDTLTTMIGLLIYSYTSDKPIRGQSQSWRYTLLTISTFFFIILLHAEGSTSTKENNKLSNNSEDGEKQIN